MLTWFHMCSRYRRAWAGFFWVIANPILTFVIQSLIFKSILKIEIENYGIFLFSGLLPWFFISQSLYVVTNSLVSSREVLLGFKIHPFTIVSSQVLDQFVSFLAAFVILGFFTIRMDLSAILFFRIIQILLSTTLLCIFTILLTNFIAFWHVFYRDIQFIIQFLMNLAFYLTPIFYLPTSLAHFQWLLKFNIFYPFIRLFQNSIYQMNLQSWSYDLLSALVENFLLGVFLWASYKLKMKEFYINV